MERWSTVMAGWTQKNLRLENRLFRAEASGRRITLDLTEATLWTKTLSYFWRGEARTIRLRNVQHTSGMDHERARQVSHSPGCRTGARWRCIG